MAAGQRRAAVNGRKHGASLLRIRLPQKRRRELALPVSDGKRGEAGKKADWTDAAFVPI